MGVQIHYKKRFTKKSCRKALQSIRQKNPKPIVFSICLLRFWAFIGEGNSKTRKKNIEGTNPIPVLFWPLTHPATTGVTDLFCRPQSPWEILGWQANGELLLSVCCIYGWLSD
jgi:hypothetical protein